MQLTQNPFYAALQHSAKRLQSVPLSSLMQDSARSKAFSYTFDCLRIDITRQRLDQEAFDMLLRMAQAADIEAKRDAMLAGEAINTSENRPVLHCRLRDPQRFASAEWHKLAAFAENQRQDPSVTDIINIGIGGSDLGPAMVSAAMAPFAGHQRIHYVANVDPSHLHDTLCHCNPATTRFIITSKTFTTAETLTNAALAKDWLIAQDQNPQHTMAAVTAAPDKAAAWGIAPARVFDFEQGIGGRYSLWSAVGLPVMIQIGSKNFQDFLAGAHALDQHFATAALKENLPVLLALLRVWNRNFMGNPAHGIMPYDQRLHRLPAWAQQLEMESNGKSVTREGEALTAAASPLIWGEPGTNAQHSFFQFLHQGLDVVPLDILVPLQPLPHKIAGKWQASHHTLVTNAIAQAEALAVGAANTEEPHRHFAGNRPSTLISWEQTTPYTLGQLLALYEHITAVSGFIWGINSFDQWGVELGKTLALQLAAKEGLQAFSPAARALMEQMPRSLHG